MLILDSNILYYIHGLSNPPTNINVSNLKAIIQEYNSSVAISSISLWEILLHYRNQAKSIRRLSTFMRCNHIRIYNDKYIAVPSKEKYDFTQIKQQELKQFISNIMPRKIYVESHFACVVYLLTLFSITYFDAFPQAISINMNTANLISSVFSFYRDLSVSFFEEIYAQGYKADNCENYVRGAFHHILQLTIPPTISLLKKLADITPEEDLRTRLNDVSFEEWHKETLRIANSVKKKNTPTVYISKHALYYGKSINDKRLTDFLDKMWTSIGDMNIEYVSIKEYIFSIIKNIILHGSSFWKNDINDALILGSIKDSDLILTLDNGMIDHMRTHTQSHSGYDQSLRLINQIYLV